jgi:hypothetical protein
MAGVRSAHIEVGGAVERFLVAAGGGQPQEEPGPRGQVHAGQGDGRVVTRRQTGTEGS